MKNSIWKTLVLFLLLWWLHPAWPTRSCFLLESAPLQTGKGKPQGVWLGQSLGTPADCSHVIHTHILSKTASWEVNVVSTSIDTSDTFRSAINLIIKKSDWTVTKMTLEPFILTKHPHHNHKFEWKILWYLNQSMWKHRLNLVHFKKLQSS